MEFYAPRCRGIAPYLIQSVKSSNKGGKMYWLKHLCWKKARNESPLNREILFFASVEGPGGSPQHTAEKRRMALDQTKTEQWLRKFLWYWFTSCPTLLNLMPRWLLKSLQDSLKLWLTPVTSDGIAIQVWLWLGVHDHHSIAQYGEATSPHSVITILLLWHIVIVGSL